MNDHEGDWEMIQLVFSASSAKEALTQRPVEVVYAQHDGSERSSWTDPKLQKEDGRPVVYSGKGSHASYFDSVLYLDLIEGGTTGFGCDDTRGPHRRLELSAIVVPDEPPDQNGSFAWLAYDGLWGATGEPGFRGPTGPNTKDQWTEPLAWADNARDSSLTVPEFTGLGESPVAILCGTIYGGSRVLLAFFRAPVAALVGLLGFIVVIGWFFRYTRDTVRTSWQMYHDHFLTFVLIGAAFVQLGFVFAGLQRMIFSTGIVESLLTHLERWPGARAALALGVGSPQLLLGLIIVTPASIWAANRSLNDDDPDFREAYRQGLRMTWRVVRAWLYVLVRVFIRAITIVGIPWALVCTIKWSFIEQAVVVENAESGDAAALSARLAKGRLWKTFSTVLVLMLTAIVTGPLIAILILVLIPSHPIAMANIVSGIVFALVVPLVAVGVTVLYIEFKEDPETGPKQHGSDI